MSSSAGGQYALFAFAKESANYAEPAESAESAESASSIQPEKEITQCAAETAETAETAEIKYNERPLPHLLGQIVSLGRNKQERELLLFSGIASLSVCFPTVSGIYGDKRYSPNIFFMAVGPAASGKGKMNLCRSILLPIHEQLQENSNALQYKEMLLIPANCSSTAFQEILSKNHNGCIIFETEGDTLSETFGQDYGDYSSCFRAAFEHEMISYARRENKEYVVIKNPKLSVLLSGTPNQVVSLIKDTENGLFSRFAFYRLEATDDFHVENNSEEAESKEEKCRRIGEELQAIYNLMFDYNSVNFKMSNEHWEKFNKGMNSIKEEYFRLYDKNHIRASIWRLGVIRFRISMILAILKAVENEDLEEEIYCDEDSFEIANQITRVFAENMTQVYRILPKASKANRDFSSEFERKLYDAMPKHFTKAEFNSKAESLGHNSRTIERYLTAWIKDDLLTRLRIGEYAKKSID